MTLYVNCKKSTVKEFLDVSLSKSELSYNSDETYIIKMNVILVVEKMHGGGFWGKKKV